MSNDELPRPFWEEDMLEIYMFMIGIVALAMILKRLKKEGDNE